MANLINIVVGVVTVIVVLVLLRQRRESTKLPFPPGPPQRIWSGNFYEHPKKQPWLTYTAWARSYGPIVYCRHFSERIIILNSAKAALDLLESRSAIYSDRPVSWMFGELIGRKLNAFRVPFNHPRFKRYRKMMHSGLNPRAVQGYKPIQEREVRQLLKGLAESPERFIAHLRRNSGALIMKVIYGYDVSEDNDYFVKVAEDAFLVLQSQKLSRPFMVDYFPILRFVPGWFPFAEFKRTANEAKKMNAEAVPFEWAKKIITSGNYTESFMSRFLRPDGGPIVGEDEQDVILWCTAGLYVGGTDTTPSAMTTFFALMALYPEVQRSAQAEIDRVVGDSRLPTVNDREAMPYMLALLKEVIRWGPPGPSGFKHRLMEDDVYEGYRIPKGCSIIANIWAITHDPEIYPNPSKFDPNRHLGPSPQTNPFKFVFGFGRRVCPGAYLAEVNLFLAMANIIATFDIGKKIDEDGKEIDPPIEWMGGEPAAHLKPFECRITPRSSASLALVEA